MMNKRSPYAIWFQSIPGFQGAVSLVNDLYRFEIYEVSTGRRVRMENRETLSMAKHAVLMDFTHREWQRRPV
jgi:hypothetical protein